MVTNSLTFRIINIIGIILCIIAVFPLLLIHCRMVYQDMHTEERKSVAYRKGLNKELKKSYRARGYLAILMLTCYLFGDIFWLCSVTVAQTQSLCILFDLLCGGLFIAGKMSMYSVWMLRFHEVFDIKAQKMTSDQKKSKCMVTTVFILFVGAPVSWSLMLYGALTVDDMYAFDTDSFPYSCSSDIPPEYGAPYILAELGINIMVLILFYLPVTKVVTGIMKLSDPDDEGTARSVARFKFTRSKQMVLVYTACLSTFLTYILWIVTDLDNMYTLDTVINSICVMLLSPYYSYIRDRKGKEWLYRFWCRPCIICFCQKHYSLDYYNKSWQKTQGNMSSPSFVDRRSRGDTAETMSLPRIAMALNASNSDANVRCVNDDEDKGVELASKDKLATISQHEVNASEDSVEQEVQTQITALDVAEGKEKEEEVGKKQEE